MEQKQYSKKGPQSFFEKKTYRETMTLKREATNSSIGVFD